MKLSIFRSSYAVHKESFVNQLAFKFMSFKFYLIRQLAGNTKIVMNITVTSDIIDYNKLNSPDAILCNNKIKTVSSRQSFVLNPSNTTYVR